MTIMTKEEIEQSLMAAYDKNIAIARKLGALDTCWEGSQHARESLENGEAMLAEERKGFAVVVKQLVGFLP